MPLPVPTEIHLGYYSEHALVFSPSGVIDNIIFEGLLEEASLRHYTDDQLIVFTSRIPNPRSAVDNVDFFSSYRNVINTTTLEKLRCRCLD